jgi:tetratricopeptide (TPR) repeat protein
MRATRRGPALLLVTALTFALSPVSRCSAQTTEADVHLAQAIIAIDERRYDAALTELKRALEIEPDHVEALYYTGVVYVAQGRPDLAVPPLERARAKAPADPAIGFQLGLAFFAQQRYDRAQPLFEAAFKTKPELDGLGYYVGFLRYRAKDYRGALAAFRAGRASDPEIRQLMRVYSGLTLAILGLPAQAAAEVEEALRLAPGSAVTGPVERLRDTIVAARARERRLSLDARVGFTYDDNVRVVPSQAGREPLVADLRSLRHRSTGELFGVRADYAWWRSEDWESSLGYSFFTTYNNDLPRFNVIDHLVSAGLARKLSLGGRPAQLGLQYSYEWLGLGGDEFLARHIATLSGAVVEGEHHLTRVFGRYQDKDFAEGLPRPLRQEVRDANNYMVGLLHLVRFAQDRHFLTIGYQLDWDQTDGRDYEYVGHRLSAGAQYTLPWGGVRLKYDFDVHLRSYPHKDSILPTYAPGTRRRADEEYTHVARAELPLPGRFTLAVEFLMTNARSNIEVFDFDRHVVSLVLSWTY